MKKQLALLVCFLITTFLFAQDVDITIATADVDSNITVGEYTLVRWSAKSRGNTAVVENKIKFFLSEDNELSRDDLFLGGALVPELIEGREGNVKRTWVRIPSDIKAGNYTFFFHVDADNEIAEVSEADNAKAEDVQVVANLESDLVVEATNLPLTAVEGNQLQIGWAIKNQGKKVAKPTYLTVYLSTTPRITDDAVKILGVQTGAVGVGERITADAIVTIPSDSKVDGGVIGKRYLVFDTDSNSEEKESNENNNTDFKRINISGSSDLVSANIVALGSIGYIAPHTQGVIYDVSLEVKNQGNSSTQGVSTVKCYLSQDSDLDENDELIYTSEIPVLAANGGVFKVEFDDDWFVNIPGSPRDMLDELLRHKVIVVVDSEQVISESNEDNNVANKNIVLKPSNRMFNGLLKQKTTVSFPNPVQNSLNVTVADNTVITLYSVVSGAKVLSKAFNQAGEYKIDIASLKNGNYILKDNKGKKLSIIKE